MNIKLIRATIADAQQLWEMQVKSFQGLLDKYQDYDTNPACEPVDKMIRRLQQKETYYYFICIDDRKVGAIRVVDHHTERNKRISPLYVLPEFRNRGVAQKAIQICEAIHGSENWELETILQEAGNCHLYEKVGYQKTNKLERVNDKMTLVYYVK